MTLMLIVLDLDELPRVAILAVVDHVDVWGGISFLCEVDAEYM